MMRLSHFLFIRIFCLLLAGSAVNAQAAACPLDPDREASVGEEIRLSVFDGEVVDIRLPGAGSDENFLAVHYAGRADLKPFVITHGPGQTLASHFVTDLSLSLNDLGYPVLALQMPLLERQCEGPDSYPDTFDQGFARINAAASWLSDSYPQAPALVGHWIANVYFERQQNAPFDIWIMTGITGSLGSTGDNFPHILDVYGSQGHPMTLRFAWLRRFWLWLDPGSSQVEIAGADHEFNGRMADVATEVDQFVKAVAQK